MDSEIPEGQQYGNIKESASHHLKQTGIKRMSLFFKDLLSAAARRKPPKRRPETPRNTQNRRFCKVENLNCTKLLNTRRAH